MHELVFFGGAVPHIIRVWILFWVDLSALKRNICGYMEEVCDLECANSAEEREIG